MRNINRVMISGNLTRDAELRSTSGGTGVLSFGVAVNDSRKNPQTGEWEDYPNFIDCTLFGNLAHAIASRMLKGTKVCIEGKLRYSSWERDGQKRSKVEVIVDQIEVMGAAQAPQPTPQGYAPAPQQNMPAYGATAPQGYVQQPAMQPVQRAVSNAAQQVGFYDEDIPF